MSALAGDAAAIGMALYAAHHVGDYWVQTDHQAAHKGDKGIDGVLACLTHVLSYLATQVGFLFILCVVTGLEVTYTGVTLGIAVSGVTHYAADRREYGIMFRIARAAGSRNFMELGIPRGHMIEDVPAGVRVSLDNPCLGTGRWALDQSWHIALSVFVPALIMVAL